MWKRIECHAIYTEDLETANNYENCDWSVIG
ncbi:hypothetical protein J2Y73_005109 [Peribacillus frigoritolerans]|jgi:hypothetical protein|nr:hypothetical protein [Peribacillus frigoritolerans]